MRILLMGGDARMIYAAEKLSEKHEVSVFGMGKTRFPEPRGKYGAVVLPLPLSKDGKTVSAPLADLPITFETLEKYADESTLVAAGGTNAALSKVCEGIGCGLYDYFSDETLTLQNAALTAEAAAALFIMNCDGSLLGASALITGSGRIARFLAERLAAFGCRVTVAARNGGKRALARLAGYGAIALEELRERLGEFDYIANAVPSPLFGEAEFSAMKRTAVFQELASLPELPASEHARLRGVRYIYAGGLPGKYSPKTAGEFIASAVNMELSSKG